MMLSWDRGGKSLQETRVLLLRHAETSDPDRFHGAESDVGLGERGIEQAGYVAQVIAAQRPDAIYCSGLRRAIETAEVIARTCRLAARVEPELHERKMGPLSGISREEGLEAYLEAKRRWKAGEIDYTHEGGESYAQIRQRALPVLGRLAASAQGQTIVIVAHGVVIRVLLTTILEGFGPADFDAFPIDNVALNDLRWDGARWAAVALNHRIASELDSFAW
jgi:broad specificity phosphatase PhoE